MKSHKCNHQVSFATSLLVTNPHNYPCPHCQKRLTLDKTGRRYLLATVTASCLYASVIGTMSLLAARQGTPMGQIIIANLIALAFGPLVLLPILYLGWKRSRFIEREKLEHVRQSAEEQVTSEKPPFRYRPFLSPSKC